MYTLVVGGAYQGKYEYAKSIVKDGIVLDCAKLDDDSKNIDTLVKYISNHKEIKGIANIGYLVRTYYKADTGNDIDNITSNIIENINTLFETGNIKVITIKEEGLGIIPLEKEDRRYRECIGKVGCHLALNADKVVRIVCGIETVIKG